MSSQHHLVASPALSSSRQPRLSLLMRALHPICRHYTLSVRVRRHVTGAPPAACPLHTSPHATVTRVSCAFARSIMSTNPHATATKQSSPSRRSQLCTHRPHFHLFQGAVHPIRRQCTSSVRVHRHVTGAPPAACPLHTSPHATVTRVSCAFARSIMSTNPHATATRVSCAFARSIMSTSPHATATKQSSPSRRSHLCTHRPHFHLFQGAVHPIRRHYTRSERVQRHITGAAPRNGCSAT